MVTTLTGISNTITENSLMKISALKAGSTIPKRFLETKLLLSNTSPMSLWVVQDQQLSQFQPHVMLIVAFKFTVRQPQVSTLTYRNA